MRVRVFSLRGCAHLRFLRAFVRIAPLAHGHVSLRGLCFGQYVRRTPSHTALLANS